MNLKNFGFKDIDYSKLDSTNTPYKIYAEVLDEIAQEQFYDVLKAPFVTYGALMPDAHAGYTMPIGGVCSTKGMIVPQFVGFDIGCGMCAYKTDFTKSQIDSKSDIIYNHIIDRVPLGFSKHKNHQPFKSDLPLTDFAEHILKTSGLMQIGTLGGGNHFIEVGYGSDDKAWIVIHSGSRGFGHKIASHYMIEAYKAHNPVDSKLEEIIEDFEKRNEMFKEKMPEKYEKSLKKFRLKQIEELNKRSDINKIKGIWGLDTSSQLGQDYIKDQNFALNYALENRKRMIETIHTIMNELFEAEYEFKYEDEQRFINKNHNHAEYDETKEEWIHRKGATHASEGMMGVIPANMRDGSFVVRGKGCEESISSSSHGAGRVMSRKKAKESIALEDFEDSMVGIIGTVDKNTIDESPFAYKDIFEVMELQEDLVDVVEHIKVLINVKDNSKSRY